MCRTYNRDGASINSLENLFQCFTTLTGKNVFLTSNLSLLSFSLKRITNNSQGLKMLASQKGKKGNNLHGQELEGIWRNWISLKLPPWDAGVLSNTDLWKIPCFHRIIEWFRLEGTFEIIQFQPPCYRQGHFPLDQVVQSPIQPGLQCFQEGGIHGPAGQPVSVSHHTHSKEFLPNIQF